MFILLIYHKGHTFDCCQELLQRTSKAHEAKKTIQILGKNVMKFFFWEISITSRKRPPHSWALFLRKSRATLHETVIKRCSACKWNVAWQKKGGKEKAENGVTHGHHSVYENSVFSCRWQEKRIKVHERASVHCTNVLRSKCPTWRISEYRQFTKSEWMANLLQISFPQKNRVLFVYCNAAPLNGSLNFSTRHFAVTRDIETEYFLTN